MSNQVKIAIIIPCFNEQDTILKLYNEILSTKYNDNYNVVPVFINDCSSDGSEIIMRQNNLTHLNLAVNLGIGGAMQTGFMYALNNGFDIVVQMDGDGQHPPAELEKIVVPILNNEADVVIGSRYIEKEGFQSSGLRRFGINYFKNLNYYLAKIKVNDSTSGYRAFNKQSLNIVANYYPDEYPEPETIMLFKLHNLRVLEVPVFMRERQGGESSIRTYKTIYYMFKVTLGIIFLYIRFKFNGKRSSL